MSTDRSYIDVAPAISYLGWAEGHLHEVPPRVMVPLAQGLYAILARVHSHLATVNPSIGQHLVRKLWLESSDEARDVLEVIDTINEVPAEKWPEYATETRVKALLSLVQIALDLDREGTDNSRMEQLHLYTTAFVG